jgi:hypothetical protein
MNFGGNQWHYCREVISVEKSLPSWDDSMLLMFAAAKTEMLVLVVVVV